MIHVLTVHWRSDHWIDIQLQYLHRHLRGPIATYEFLNEVRGDHLNKFDFVFDEPIKSHALKLNRHAEEACSRARYESDVLVFLDGDAFPIADLGAYLDGKLSAYPLVAVRRTENLGDCQPHPSFAATTVGVWRRIGGDWREGFSWMTTDGRRTTDVGGNLLGILSAQSIPWYPMQRSNRVDLHPVFFGIYDGIVYHHGAGFRHSWSRVDQALIGRGPASGGFLRRWLLALHPAHHRARRHLEGNESLKDMVYREVRSDAQFFRRFQSPIFGE